jgi:hypothetical protein
MSRLTRKNESICDYCEYERNNGCIKTDPAKCVFSRTWNELQHYKDLEEQGRLIDWRKTSEEKPDSTRHLIVAYGEIISHYGYYLKPKDKWFTDWTCEKEMDAPMFWADMPDPPEESLHGDCGAKMDEVENER